MQIWGGAKDIGDHPHMTSLFLRGEGVHKIVTLSDVRGGIIEKSDVTKNAIIYNANNIL